MLTTVGQTITATREGREKKQKNNIEIEKKKKLFALLRTASA